MGLLDNDTVIVDAILTKVGRQKLANGQPLGVTQYAFGDTGVDYTLYNADHPSGSDSYGSAITSLPMLEAVPDNDVFLRYRLYGEGERNVQNFSFITVENSAPTITKVAGETISNPINIIPNIFPNVQAAKFNFTVLDMRGLSVSNIDSGVVNINGDFGVDNLPPFSHPEPVKATILGAGQITLNAQPQQITAQRTIGIEVSREGAASAFVTVTINTNNVA